MIGKGELVKVVKSLSEAEKYFILALLSSSNAVIESRFQNILSSSSFINGDTVSKEFKLLILYFHNISRFSRAEFENVASQFKSIADQRDKSIST